MIDLHLHSHHSHDGEGEIADFCQRALELGLVEIGFLEHLDLYPLDPHFGLHNYERYLEEIERARRDFPELKIRMGVEVTYLPGIRKEIQEFLEDKDYDYVIGAVHLVEDGSFTVSEPEPARDFFSTRSPKECYEHYFELVLDATRSGLFDGIAHLDLVNRYGLNYYPDWQWQRFYGVLRRIFEGMIKRQMALELNLSGWGQLPARPYPEPSLLSFFQELGGELIYLGTDAHQPEQLGAGINPAIKLLKELGIKKLVSFEKRRVSWVSLEEKNPS